MDKNGLEQALTEILQKAVSGVEKGVGFLQTELPEAVSQLLLWHFWKSLIFNVLGLIIIITVVFFAKRAWILFGKIEDEPVILLPLISFMIMTTLSLVLFDIVWLQILIAPKLYLIEYAAELIK